MRTKENIVLHCNPKKQNKKKKKLRILYLCTLKMKQREVTRASTPFKTRGHSVNYLAATTTNTLLLTVSAPWEVGEGRGGPLGNSLLTTPVRRYGGEVVIYRNLYTSSDIFLDDMVSFLLIYRHRSLFFIVGLINSLKRVLLFEVFISFKTFLFFFSLIKII